MTTLIDLDDMGTTLGGIIEGGPVVWLIAAVGAVGVLVLVERLYVIVVRSKNNGRAFIERIIQLVRAGKIDDAIKQCTESTAALPDIGLLILRSRTRDAGELQNVADAASLMVIPKLTHRIDYLPTLALAAALFGVLGTVFGVRDAFIVASAAQSSSAPSTQFWTRLADSMTPVSLGLIVAIVLVLGRGYLVSQAASINEQIREFSARLINALTDQPDVRLGHR